MSNQRDEKLHQFLDAINARLLVRETFGAGSISMYSANGRTFMVQHFAGRDGWDIYVPASDRNNIEATTTAAASYIEHGTVVDADAALISQLRGERAKLVDALRQMSDVHGSAVESVGRTVLRELGEERETGKQPDPVKFAASRFELQLIAKIAARDVQLAAGYGATYKQQDAMMDIEACHSNGRPLDLQKLLAADDGTFGHDVFGIRRHLDRETGKLGGCFLPRCAMPSA